MFERSRIDKEVKIIKKKEEALRKKAYSKELLPWKKVLEEKVPKGAQEQLEKAFVLAFQLVFKKGTTIIEKTYKKEERKKAHEQNHLAVRLLGTRKEYKNLHKGAKSANLKNMALTTVEGVGLGILGVGMPDMVLFVGMVLKGIYECALNYGFDYEKPIERFWILKMMEVSVSKGDDWGKQNAELEQLWKTKPRQNPTEAEIDEQLQRTARALALDMLCTKFIQGLPIVGVIGGASNPVYYDKILSYVQVKYQKRYLYKW